MGGKAMDSRELMLKICGLFPSSCNLRSVPDVVQTKSNKPGNKMDKLSISSTNITAWFTSADETDAFFSLDSSNSGDSFRHLKPKTTAPKEKAWPEHQLGSDHVSTQLYYSRRRRTRRKRRPSCYAVEKRSKDPWGDFRASMVEMIVEKQIFAAEDLERLLLSFLSLNNVSYHGIIFNVFTEICQTLFANS